MTIPLQSCGEYLGGWIQIQASSSGIGLDHNILKIPEANHWITAIMGDWIYTDPYTYQLPRTYRSSSTTNNTTHNAF